MCPPCTRWAHCDRILNELKLGLQWDQWCHRYDFLVRLYRNGLNFFKLFSLFGIDHDPHVLYVHMTYVYSFFL